MFRYVPIMRYYSLLRIRKYKKNYSSEETVFIVLPACRGKYVYTRETMLRVTDARQYSSKVDSGTAVWKFDHSLTVWCPLLDENDRMQRFDCSSSSDCSIGSGDRSGSDGGGGGSGNDGQRGVG